MSGFMYARAKVCEEAAHDLGRSLEWALYWIRRLAEVPLPEEEQDEWDRWEEAQQALRKFGPESDFGIPLRVERSLSEGAPEPPETPRRGRTEP